MTVGVSWSLRFRRPDDALLLLIPEDLREANPGMVFELSPASINLMPRICLAYCEITAARLITRDYGYACARRQTDLASCRWSSLCADVLANVGEADLTALVDFGMLRQAGAYARRIDMRGRRAGANS